jgi:hypothetical protein
MKEEHLFMQDPLLDLKNARKARRLLFFNPLLDRFTNLWLEGCRDR